MARVLRFELRIAGSTPLTTDLESAGLPLAYTPLHINIIPYMALLASRSENINHNTVSVTHIRNNRLNFVCQPLTQSASTSIHYHYTIMDANFQNICMPISWSC